MFQSLVYPMFAMVVLTFGVCLLMGRARISGIASGKIDPRYFKTYRGEAPKEMEQVSRHFTNLFELPVLFYVACLTAMVTRIDGSMIIGLAWIFVVLRIIHAIIHIGPNALRARMGVYVVQWVVVMAMWIMMIIALNAR